MGCAWTSPLLLFRRYYCISHPDGGPAVRVAAVRGGTVSDVLYIGLIVVVFATLWLLVKGVERFER